MSFSVGECIGGLACVAVGGTAAALVCFSSDPVDGDPRAGYSRSWQTDMLSAPCVQPGWFCCAIICDPCAQYQLRTMALGGNMAAYRCCQGYFDTPCFRAGSCGDEGNPCCLVLEVLICPCFAVQGTRFYVMDTRNIAPSGTDNKLIRFNNALQVLACLCQFCGCDDADLVSLAADIMWCTLVGCMSAQVAAELSAERAGKADSPLPGRAPQPMAMVRYQSQRRGRRGGGYPDQGQAALPVARPMAPQPIVMGRPVRQTAGGNYIV